MGVSAQVDRTAVNRVAPAGGGQHASSGVIGHSTHTLERLIQLLKLHDIAAVGDVRSSPYSRVNPHFNREYIKEQLRKTGMTYVFLGKELGGRGHDPSCYENGRVRYGRIAASELFQHGLDRVRDGTKKYRLALLCAEKEPLDCHRMVLVGRYLSERGMCVQHIFADGRLETQSEVLGRLMRQLNLEGADIFRSQEDAQADAYRIQESRIAYTSTEGEQMSVPKGCAR